MSAPDACHILTAEAAAARSPCAKSKRGVAMFDPTTGAPRGEGWNGPPRGAPCPGREVCGDACNKLCVHAEIRALRAFPLHRFPEAPNGFHLVHVKLGADDRVTPGGPPSCWQCSREILDVGFVGGVWLYEEQERERCGGGWGGSTGHRYIDRGREVRCPICGGSGYLGPVFGDWRFYTAEEFHRVTLANGGIGAKP